MSERPTGGRWARRLGRRARVAGILALAPLLLCPAAGFGTDPSGPPPGPTHDTTVGAQSPLVLVPPLERSRRLRIHALAADPSIDRVVFFLDGREVANDARRPYRATVDLGRDVDSERALRAVAYDRTGAFVAEDSLSLGADGATRPGERFDVSILGLEGDPGPRFAEGTVELRARVVVPQNAHLDQVEVFHNDRLAARLTGTGRDQVIRTPLDLSGAGPDDYLRVVARLDDGRTLEDACPVASPGAAARLDVCLIDLFAVVSNRWGDPIPGLAAEDFHIRMGDREMAVTDFREAHQVPLALGLLVDSSESMTLIMEGTKEAGKRFLERTLVTGDEAFLIDVDTVPRLVREMSPSPGELTEAFDDLEPGGTTALYDAILMGLLRLERHQGRRALVVLTDGQDVGSDFGPELCRRHAEHAGVPIYVLAMNGLPEESSTVGRNLRLEALARRTGGRVFWVSSVDGIDRAYTEIDRAYAEIDRAYAEIAEELRSQYVLGIGSDRLLSEEELTAIDVQVDRPGTRVRATRKLARD